jgi:hypothetical protein
VSVFIALLAPALGLLGGHLLTALVGLPLQADESLPVSGWLLVSS